MKGDGWMGTGLILNAHKCELQLIACRYRHHSHIVAFRVLHAGSAEQHSQHGIEVLDLDLILNALGNAGQRQVDKAALIRRHGVVHRLVAALLQLHRHLAIVHVDGGGSSSGGLLKHDGYRLVLLCVVAKDHLGMIIGAFAGQLKGNEAVFIRLIAVAIVNDSNLAVVYLEDHFIAAGDVAVKLLAKFHLQLELAHSAVGLHRVALMALGILQGVQFLDVRYQLLGIAVGGEMVECAFKDAFFHDLAAFDQANDAVAVDDDSGGIGSQPHCGDPAGFHLRHREGQAQAGFELSDIIFAVAHLRVHGNDFQLILVQLIRLLQEGEFLLAGATVGVPEVQCHSLLGLQDLGNGVGIAIGIHNGKVGDHVAQFVNTIGGIALGDHGCGQHHIQLGALQLIHFLDIIALGNTLQDQNILIAAGCCEDDNAILVQRAPGHDLIAFHRVEHIVVHVLQYQAAGRLYRDGIDRFRNFRRQCRGGVCRLRIPACAQQHHAKQRTQDQKQYRYFLFIRHCFHAPVERFV